jgi:hypothetical protein
MALDLSPACNVPVLRVSTKANQGHAELWHAIDALPLRRPQVSAARLLLQLAVDALEQCFRDADPELLKVAEAWQRGEMPAADAVRTVLRFLI